jgi:hypothetical protein
MDTTQRELLRALHGKYVRLHALRVSAAPAHAERVRPELAELARTYPGALRELDRLPLETIAARLAAIDAVLANASEPAQWMRLQLAYHGFMRAVLRLRRGLLAYAQPLEVASVVLAVLDYQPALDEPPSARFDLGALQLIKKPPHGRLNPWVLAQVAADHGVSVAVVHDALFAAAARD